MSTVRGRTNNKESESLPAIQRPRPTPRARGQVKAAQIEAPTQGFPPAERYAERPVVIRNTAAAPAAAARKAYSLSLTTPGGDNDNIVAEAVFDDGDEAEMLDDPDADVESVGGDAGDGDDEGHGETVMDEDARYSVSVVDDDGSESMVIDTEEVSAPHRYGTRASNASKHPGLVDRDDLFEETPAAGKRRGKAAAGQPKLAKVKVNEADQRKKIARIAALEDEIILKDKAKTAMAARPAPGKVAVKVGRPVGVAKRGGKANNDTGLEDLASVRPKPRGVAAIGDNDDDADMEPAAPSEAGNVVKAKVKKDRFATRKLIDNARSSPANPTPVTATRGPKRKSDFAEIVVGEELSSPTPPSKKVKVPPPSGLLPSARGLISDSDSMGLQIWDRRRASAAVPQTIHKSTEPEASIFSNDYGGLEDGDDSREAAAQPKMKAAIAQQQTTIAKVNFNRPTIKLEQAESSLSIQTRHRPSTNDIVPQHRASWTDGVLPHFRDFLGTLRDPWNMDNPQILVELQASYDYAINDGHIIHPTDHIHALAFQRLYEWRGRFASAAVTAISVFWSTGDNPALYDTPESRADYVEFLLGNGMPFLWAEPENLTGPFQSPFVLGALATHLLSTDDLPKDERIDEPPRGALALAAAAVERALEFWKTGTYIAPTRLEGFSELNWGARTSTTFIPNVAKVGKVTWGHILAGARKIADQKSVSKSRLSRISHPASNEASIARSTMVFETI